MSDLISRQAAIKAIDDLPNCCNGYSDTYDKAYIIGTLEELPSVEPKRGKWMAIGNTGLAACKCGYITDRYSIYKHCPNCGAKMGGDIKDSE